MRHTFLLLGLLLCVSAACAAPPVPLETVSLSGVSGPRDTPTQAFSHARYNLLAGTQYVRAIQQLQFCTARDPKNRAFRLALGCALADRAASVGYSAMWTKMLADDRAHTLKSGDALPPDRSFPTKDDGHILLLSPAQTAAIVGTLSQSAQSEWKQAVALSQTPTERADAEWTRGCGLRLLRLAAQGSKSAPTQKDAADALSAATQNAPRNPVYWQSLGDALREPDRAASLAAYQKSLALEPKNAPLWFRVYHAQVKSGRDPQPNAEAALRHLVDSDPGNAFPYYLLAHLLFRRTHFGDVNEYGPEGVAPALATVYDGAQYKNADAALTQIEAGNAAPRYAVFEYVPPAPELLTGFALWQPILRISDSVFGESAHLRELARAASGCSRICAAHGDKAGLERGAWAAVGMGQRMAGGWPLRDTPGGSEVITVLVGFAVMSVGYDALVKGYALLGDAPASQSAQAEWDRFKARQVVWRAAHEAATQNETIYDAY